MADVKAASNVDFASTPFYENICGSTSDSVSEINTVVAKTCVSLIKTNNTTKTEQHQHVLGSVPVCFGGDESATCREQDEQLTEQHDEQQHADKRVVAAAALRALQHHTAEQRA